MANSVQNFAKDIVDDAKDFVQDSTFFVNRCSKPDKKEFIKIASSCALGFAVMGVVGYCIKLMFIPINNVILS